MRIEFKKVTLHNFLSFGDAVLNITDDGFIKVSGINENPDDLAVSNGSGKSSLWESITWALTGDTIRGTKQVSNIYGDDGTFVELEFYVDSKHYLITRSKDHKVLKTNLKIVIDGQDCSGKGIRDSEKLLAEYLPDITASLLGSVIILGQGLPQKFTNNTPSGRKEVLEKLSKSDFMIEDLKNRVSARKSELNTQLRVHQDAVVSATSKKEILSSQIEQSKITIQSLNKEDLESAAASYTEQITVLKKDCECLTHDINEYTTAKNHLTEELNKITAEFMNRKQTIFDTYKPQIDDLTAKSSELNAMINSLQRELTRLKSIKDVCPTCGQRLPDVIKPDTSDIESQLQSTKNDLDVVSNKLVEVRNRQQTEITLNDSNKESAESGLLKSITENEKELRELTNKFNQRNYDLQQLDNRYQTVVVSLTQLNATIESHQKIISENTIQIQELEELVLYNNTQADLIKSKLEIQSKFDTALKRDFRGHLLSSVIEYIQTRAKMYSKIIFETENIGFELDGNNIEITYLTKSYENLSGGEKQKVDLIVQFSIRDMLCAHLGFSSNIIVLDEVFDALDMIGCQKVLDVISAINDIKNIFIVTHRKDLSIPSDKELLVVKSINGISELR